MTEDEAIAYMRSVAAGLVLSPEGYAAVKSFVRFLYNDGYRLDSMLIGEDYAAQRADLVRRICQFDN
jgi:hypothetical protein